ncbi:MAG: YraN family protein [Bacteroidales bacterium]|nr:YraN family protein [Bacteroidales bacterium]MDD7726193.1 YraN family protein [Bacteroidales bacterium]MDY4175503.1 YraN family protein [Bacteroidales bacterium]
MAAHNELGQKGEDRAVEFLSAKGFKILCRNWHFRHKEVDIVALDAGVLVFVEVKTRSAFSSPNDVISYSKVRFLEEAAEAYIRQYNFQGEARFDVVLLTKKAGSFDIMHIPAAFR